MFAKAFSPFSPAGTNVFAPAPEADPRTAANAAGPEAAASGFENKSAANDAPAAGSGLQSGAKRFADKAPAESMPDEDLYRHHERNGLEAGLFRYADGSTTVMEGDKLSTGSQLLAAGDSEDDGVEELEFVAHLDPGLPELSSLDAELLAARAVLNPGVPLKHTVYGFDADGNRAGCAVELAFDGARWRIAADARGNVPEEILDEARIRLEAAALTAPWRRPHDLHTAAWSRAASPRYDGNPQTLGETIVRVRRYFVQHNLPEARVSLREVGRIRALIEIYAPAEGLIRATAKALWLTICAGIPEEKRTDAFWNGLMLLLGDTELPVKPLPGKPSLAQELARLSQTRTFPYAIDFTKDIDAQLRQHALKLRAESLELAELGALSETDALAIVALSSPELAAEWLLDAATAAAPAKSDTFAALFRHVKTLAAYADGEEPAWAEKVLKAYEIGLDHPEAETRLKLCKSLIEILPLLAGAQRARAASLAASCLDKLPPLEKSAPYSDPSGYNVENTVALGDFLSDWEKDAVHDLVWRQLGPAFNEQGEIRFAFKPEQILDVTGQLLARKPTSSWARQAEKFFWHGVSKLLRSNVYGDRAIALRLLAKHAKVVSELPLGWVAPYFTRLDEALIEELKTPAYSSSIDTEVNQTIRRALELPVGLGPKNEFLALAAAKLSEKLKATYLDEKYASESLLLLAQLSQKLPDAEKAAAKALIDATILPGHLIDHLDPEVLSLVPEADRPALAAKWLDGLESRVKSRPNLVTTVRLIRVADNLAPHLGRDAAAWRRWNEILKTLSLNADPGHEDRPRSLSLLRGRIASMLASRLPLMPAEAAVETRNRFESAYRYFVENNAILENVSIEGLARVTPESESEGEFLANARTLARKLAAHDAALPADPVWPVSPNFDRSLVTAHRLTNHLVQALTVNRFVLVTGPSGIGKSEAGRYLSERLGWKASVFNCNRSTTQEDMMQKVGVILKDGSTQFLITDGPLANALMNGQLFILNEVNLAKPGNLAFLFSILADIGEEFDYYDAATGRVEKRRIHPNFRMLATQNPDGPGRKDLNAALKNRAIEIFTGAYSDVELIALLDTKYPTLKEKYGDRLYQTLVAFHLNMQTKMRARVIGSHDEGYVWNLRHLMRLAEGFLSWPGETLSPRDVLRLFYDRVGASLMPRDREVFYDELKNHVYQGTRVKPSDVDDFKDALDTVTFPDVFAEFGIDAAHGADLARRMRLTDIPTSARYLRSILASLKAGYNIWLKGPAGTGKTRLAEFVTQLTGAKLFSDTFTPQTDEAQLKGDLKPRLLKSDDGSERLGFEHVPSSLVRALRHAAANPGERVACILDEAAFAKPDVLEELNSLIDRDGGLWVVSPDGGRIEFLERPANFQLILSSNTYGYSGVSLQSEALRSRTQEIFMDFEFGADEIDTLLGNLGAYGGGDASPDGEKKKPDGVDPTDVPEPGLVPPPVVAPAPAIIGPARQIPGPLPPLATVPPDKGPWIPYFAPQTGLNVSLPRTPAAAAAAPTPITAPASPGDIRGKLKQAGLNAPEEIIATLEEKFAALHQRLLAYAVSMGRDPDIALEFDPATQTASMSLKKPRVFKIGPDFLLKRPPEELLGIALHEGAHADISRVGSGFFWKEDELRALWAAVEDLRVNARVVDRSPGRAQEYDDMNRNDYEERFAALGDERLPHEAFLNALFHIMYGGKSSWQDDPVVGPALKEAWPSVLKAAASRPRELYPSEATVELRQARFEKILKDEILPIYQKLLEKSREILKERGQDGNQGQEGQEGDDGQDGAGDPSGQGKPGGKPKPGKGKPGKGQNQGGSPSPQDGKPQDGDKGDDSADSAIKERAKKLADSLGPQNDGEDGAGDKDGKDKAQDAGKNSSGQKQQGDKADGKSQGDKDDAGQDGQEGDGEPGDADSDASSASGKLKDYAKERAQAAKKMADYLNQNTYSSILNSLNDLANRVFSVFDQLLKPNGELEHDDRFTSGPRLDVEQAVRAVRGLTTNLNLFTRKTDPNGKDYRFSLLLDASGSMNNPERERGGLGLAALFMDVFERLDIPYSLDAFNDAYIPLKGFADNLKAVPERNLFFNILKGKYWGKGGTSLRQGLAGILERVRKERARSPKAREFVFVLTDGEEMNRYGKPIREQCEEAAKEGVIVVGIGIGEGMATVKEHFPIHLVENDPAQLPYLIAEFIKRFVQQELED